MNSLQTRICLFFSFWIRCILYIYIYIYLYQVTISIWYTWISWCNNALTTATAIPSPPFHSSRIWAPPPVPRPQSLVDQKWSHTKPGGFLLGKKGTLKKKSSFGLPKKRWMWCWYQFHDILFKISSERLWPKGSRRFRFFWILINHCVLTLCF